MESNLNKRYNTDAEIGNNQAVQGQKKRVSMNLTKFDRSNNESYSHHKNNSNNNHNSEYSFQNNQLQNQNFKNFHKPSQPRNSKILSDKLPVESAREEILNAIFSKEQQVTVVSGDTGCGKSTYIPMYIYQQCQTIKGRENDKIICTQPRRMAAIGICHRVSRLLHDHSEKLVGYHVGRDCRESTNTRILFVTSGILLQRLVHNEDTLDQYKFIILDEVHERDIDSDFIMIFLKSTLHKHPNTKLILMSATIDTSNLSYYFSKEAIEMANLTAFDYNKNSVEDIWDKIDATRKINRVLGIKPHTVKEEGFHHPDEWNQHNPNDKEYYGENDWDDTVDNDEWDQKDKSKNTKIETPQIHHSHKYNHEGGIRNTPAVVCTIDNTKGARYERHTYKIDEISRFIDMMIKYDALHDQKYILNVKQYYSDMMDVFNIKKAHYIKEAILISVNIIRYIDENVDESKSLQEPLENKGTFLVFAPGYNEIFYWINTFEIEVGKSKFDERYDVIALHSSNADDVQDTILKNQKSSKRKIIVATNIAESSITIPNGIYVIDFGLSKENNFDKNNFTERLELTWASKASFLQRAGRVGRINTGYIFQLVTSNFYRKLPDYVTTELLRSPLEKVVLRIKKMHENEKERNNNRILLEDDEDFGRKQKGIANQDEASMDIEDDRDIIKNKKNVYKKYIFDDPLRVLGRALEPPGHLNVASALENLLHTGCITNLVNKNIIQDDCNAIYEYQITILGDVYRELPCNIYVCKLLLLGYLFEAYSECVTLAALIQSPKPLIKFDRDNLDPAPVKDREYKYAVASDHLKMLEKFQVFETHIKNYHLPNGENWDILITDERKFHRFLARLRNNAKKEQNLIENMKKLAGIDVLTGINVLEIRWDLVRRLEKINPQFTFSNIIDIEKNAERVLLALAGAFFDQYLFADFIPERLRLPLQNELLMNQRGEQMQTVVEHRSVVIRSHSLFLFIPRNPNSHEEISRINKNYSFYNKTQEQILNVWLKLFQKMVLEQYGVVSKILFEMQELIVEFDKATYHQAIRRILHHTIAAYEDQQRATRIFSARTGSERVAEDTFRRNKKKDEEEVSHRFFRDPRKSNAEQLESDIREVIHQFGDVYYKYEMKLHDIFYYRDVKIDNGSYCKVLIPDKVVNEGVKNEYECEIDPIPENIPKVIVAQSFYENESKRVTARGVSCLPSYHLLLPFLVMIFGVQIRIELDNEGQRYSRILHKDKTIEIDYIMTKENLREINHIRTCLRSYYLQLDNKTGANLSTLHKGIFEKIINLLRTKRTRYLTPEKWMVCFEKDRQVFLSNLKADFTKSTKESYVPLIPNLSKKNIVNEGNQKTIVTNQISKMQSRDNNTSMFSGARYDFYENIKDLKFSENGKFNFSNTGMLNYYKAYIEKYLEWKSDHILELYRYKKLINVTETQVLCGICGAEVFDAKHLMESGSNTILWKLADNGRYYLDPLPDSILINELIKKKREELRKYNNLQGWGCMGKHLIAITYGELNSKYLLFETPLKLRYPDLYEEAFLYSNFDKKKILEDQILRRQNVQFPTFFECKVCLLSNISKGDFVKHMNSKDHLVEERNFQKIDKTWFIKQYWYAKKKAQIFLYR